MANIKEFLRHNEKSQDHLKKLTDPLKQSFGIDVFWHCAVHQDGQLYGNCNYNEATFHFWENQCFHDMGFYISPTRLKSGYFLLDYDQGYEKYMDLIKGKYHLHHPFLIIRKGSDNSVNLFGFSSKKHTPALPSLYLNNLPILDSYLDYYLEANRPIIKKSEDNSVDIAKLRGQDIFHKGKYSEESLSQKERNVSMLNKIGISKCVLNAALKLTLREKQILNASVEGKTAAQCGKELGLSPRTVQSYLENVKDKLGVCTRDELLHYGRLLKKYGIVEAN